VKEIGIKERRQREKQATRDGILQAAKTIARAEGWGAVTVRKLADAIEYSPPTIYEYFDNKDAVLNELVHDGFTELTQELRQASNQSTVPAEQLLAIGLAYYRFAKDQPELYRIMHGMGGVALDPGVVATNAQLAGEVSQGVLHNWAAESDIQLDELEAVELLWSTLHGLTLLGASNRLGGGDERAERLIARAIQDFLTAWRVQGV